MNNTALISLHEKALNVLELIKDAKRREESHSKDAKIDFISREYADHYLKRAEAMKAVQCRLQKSYARLLERITAVAVK